MKATHKHLLALGVSTLYIVAVYFIMGIYFSTNDDRFMSELMSGAITGNMESHLVYVNYLLSLPLSLLYHITDGIPWFGILLVIFHWFSCFSILDSFYDRAKTKTDIFIGTILTCILFLTELYLVSQISYTMTATFMATAGYICLILKENRKSATIYFTVLELLAFLLRDKAMLMIQPLGFALFFGLVIIDKNETLKTKLLQFVKTAGILIVIVLTGFIGTKIGYHSAEWQTYNEYNTARTIIFDYNKFPPYEEVAHILDKYSVSETDYNAYADYTILDWELNLDCVKELAEFMEQNKQSPSISAILDDFKIATFKENYLHANTVLICSFIVVALFILFSGDFIGLIPYICFLLARTAIWIYLLYEGRFPLRIAMPLFACEMVFLAVLAFYLYIEKKTYTKWQNIVFLGLGAMIGVVSLWTCKIQFVTFKQTNQVHEIYIQGLDDVLEYCNTNSENKYILDTMDFVWYNNDVFDAAFQGKRNCISAGSWYAGSSSLLEGNYQYLNTSKNGFYYIMLSETDSYEEELNNPTVLYLADVSQSTPIVADSFVATHGGTYSVIYFDGSLDLKMNP